MKKTTFICLLLWSATAWGQETQSAESLRFYSEALEQGKSALAQGDYTKAASLFQAARDNIGNTPLRREDAQEWIDSTQRTQIVALKQLNVDLIAAKEKSDRSAREAEANRLATLSAQLYREQNYADALALACIGMQKVENHPLPTIQQVFGDAGYQYAKKFIFVPGIRLSHCAAAPNGQTLVAATEGGQLHWYAADGTPIRQAPAHQGPVLFLLFSPDGAQLVSGGADGLAKIWGLAGEPKATLSGHTGDVLGAAWNKSGDRLLTCGRDGKAILWEASGRQIAVLDPHGPVYQAVFVGNRIATRAANKTVQYWDENGQRLHAWGGTAYCYDLAVAPQQDALLMAFADGTAQLYLPGTDKLIALPHPGMVQHVFFDPQGKHLLTLSQREARLWDRNGQLLTTRAHQAFLDVAAFAPDGQSFLTASRDGKVRLWDLSGQLQTTIDLNGPVRSAAFSPDGGTLLVGADGPEASLWNRKGEKQMTLNGHRGSLKGAAFVPGTGYVLTYAEDNTVILCAPPAALYGQLKAKPLLLSAEKRKGYGVMGVER